MKKLLFIWTFSILISGCKKNETISDYVLSDNIFILSRDVINSCLVSVDSSSLTFTANVEGIDKIRIGSILVSDISNVAPAGFLRKVTGISSGGNTKVFTTEQASLTDAIVDGKVTYIRKFIDSDIIGEDSSGIDITSQGRTKGLSFKFGYNMVLYDFDGDKATTNDQIRIDGEMKIEPEFEFMLEIENRNVKKFATKLTIKNTNNISAQSKIVLASFNKEIVLKTFELKPFTILIAGLPVPIAKQWIAIVLGVDGNLTARVSSGAQNINTAVAGIKYENNSWQVINSQENSFTLLPLTFEGVAKIEPWLQARYEIRPYGIKESRIYIGVRGSLIGEANVNSSGMTTTLKWGVKFSAKAQMQIWNRAVLDYEKIFFEKEYPISQSTSATIPTLITTSISNITGTSALSGGTISSDGGSSVIARGVCFSALPNPTIANKVTSDGTGAGSFTSSLTNLASNTVYHVRAYASNNAGTAYGNEVIFTTQKSYGNTTTVQDIDGNIYNTVIIGSQKWMAENLRTTRYLNGDIIPTGLSATAWMSTTSGAYGFPDSISEYNYEYGKLYNWYAVNDVRKVCPSGWHVPNDTEWIILINYLGGENVAADPMKEAGGIHWETPNTGTNTSGFSARGSGKRSYNGGRFVWFRIASFFWSSTQWPIDYAYAFQVEYYRSITPRFLEPKGSGFSVRCIKD